MNPSLILLVDDDVYFRRSVELLLQHAGHRVFCAGEVRQALRLLNEHAFDVVLTDMLIGEEDGIEVVRAAHAKQPSPRVVAMSGGGTQLRASFCLNLAVAFGAAVPLLKPFSADELLSAIEPGPDLAGSETTRLADGNPAVTA